MPRPTPKTKAGKRAKAAQVMREYSQGELHSGSGETVTNPSQAKAIAMNVSGQAKPKRTRRPSRAPKHADLVVVGRS